jgi:hypothetical protein
MKLDTTYSPQLQGLNPYIGDWHDSKFGNGIIIGLVDSGIWTEVRVSKITKCPKFLQNGKDSVKIAFISTHHFVTRNSLEPNSSTKDY